MQLYAGTACALLGAAMTFSFGNWSESLTLLIILMAIDYMTGIAAAVKEGSGLNSSIGFWGLLKKGLILLVIMITHRIDVLLGADLIMGSAVFFYIANELLSITENYGRMGLPLPDKLRNVVAVLRNRAGEKGEDSNKKS
ncbi:phage holin family protein [Cohnella hongkongensis]|uniref:Holin family protein n=1 Tax=Cohnella hongkongensis TaxID=178337 RepID=A0ABV9F9R1_9BACL